MGSLGTMSHGGGRPMIPGEEKRRNQLQVLLTDEEYDAVCKEARRLRLTLSTCARNALIRAGVLPTGKPGGSSS